MPTKDRSARGQVRAPVRGNEGGGIYMGKEAHVTRVAAKLQNVGSQAQECSGKGCKPSTRVLWQRM